MPMDLDLIFAALADPTRRAILSVLMAGDRTVGALAGPHEMSLAAISKHLQVLARAGLLAQERHGRVVTCRALPDGLRAAGIWIQGVGGFDPDDLDALEALIRAGLAAGMVPPDNPEQPHHPLPPPDAAPEAEPPATPSPSDFI